PILGNPVRIYDKNSTAADWIIATIEFDRAYSESKRKGDRVGDHWDTARRLAREEGEPMTSKRPEWVDLVDGRFVEKPARAAIVRSIFAWSVSGYGTYRIVQRLVKEGVEPWGRGPWSKAYVHNILTGRAVLGEHHPTKDGQPDGDPIK